MKTFYQKKQNYQKKKNKKNKKQKQRKIARTSVKSLPSAKLKRKRKIIS